MLFKLMYTYTQRYTFYTYLHDYDFKTLLYSGCISYFSWSVFWASILAECGPPPGRLAGK